MMKKNMTIIIATLSAFVLLAGVAQAAVKVMEHPLIKPYPGSKVRESKVLAFDRVELPTGKGRYDRSARGYVFESSVKIEGKVTALRYQTPRDRSVLEVLENYKEGLAGGGFEILFSCLEKECGRGDLPKKYFRNGNWGSAETGLVTARLKRAEGDIYVSVVMNQHNGSNSLLIVEARPMETGLVKVDADALLNDIERTGHASVYGIYFDSGKAVVKPESDQALAEIAELLGKKPDLKLYVVGHTDNVGTLEYNMGLSERRARAVADRLAKNYGIAPSRLHAAGVGPLSPVFANTSDAGRAKNRRVELVAQ